MIRRIKYQPLGGARDVTGTIWSPAKGGGYFVTPPDGSRPILVKGSKRYGYREVPYETH